jgi:hypothetical protein
MNDRKSYTVTISNGPFAAGTEVWLSNQMNTDLFLTPEVMDLYFEQGRAMYARAANGLGGYVNNQIAKVSVATKLELI